MGAEENEFDVLEEGIQHCRRAIKSERSRRDLQHQIEVKTRKSNEKKMKEQSFKHNRRAERLTKVTPYPLRSQPSLGQ